MTWSAGLSLRPGSKTSIRGTYGRRNQTDTIEMSGSYNFSSRTQFQMSYTETIQTSQRLISENLGQVTTGPGGILIDPSTGLPFVQNSDQFGLQDNAFRQKNLRGTLNGTRGRTSFNVTGNRESRLTEATRVEQIVYGVTGSLTRQLTDRMTGTASASYTNTDFGTPDGRIDDRYQYSLGTQYQLNRTLSSNLALSRIRRDSTVDAGESLEHTVVVTLRQSF